MDIKSHSGAFNLRLYIRSQIEKYWTIKKYLTEWSSVYNVFKLLHNDQLDCLRLDMYEVTFCIKAYCSKALKTQPSDLVAGYESTPREQLTPGHRHDQHVEYLVAMQGHTKPGGQQPAILVYLCTGLT